MPDVHLLAGTYPILSQRARVAVDDFGTGFSSLPGCNVFPSTK